jgi:hypothetical protein
MSELLSGYSAKCDDSAGIETWYAFTTKDCGTGDSNIETLTIVDGNVTALTLVTGKYAYPFNVEQETSNFVDKAIGSTESKSKAREITATIVFHGNTADMITQIEGMTESRTTLIAKCNDGTYEILAPTNGMKCMDERASGQKYDDLNGNTLTFTGREKLKARKISSSIVMALLEPAS